MEITTNVSLADALVATRAYQSAAADGPRHQVGSIWLPAGWLAIVLILSSSVPAFGGEWRARGTQPTRVTTHKVVTASASTAEPRMSSSGWASTGSPVNESSISQPIRTVGFEDDIAGPALRVANRPMRSIRVAQENGNGEANSDLLKAIERPFGVSEEEVPAQDNGSDEGLFNDLPDDPFEKDDKEMESFSGHPIDNGDTMQVDTGDFQEEPAPIQPEVIPSKPLSPAVNAANQESAQNCEEGRAALKAKRLDSIDLSIGVHGVEGEDYPYICSIDDGTPFAPRCWAEVTYHWKATALCHKPLYFEDVHLERYGHSWGPVMQPIMSGAHFFTRIPVLPYCMGLQAPNECVYTLGQYRPGSCAPYMIDPIPFTWRAAFFQAGATVGVAGILP